MVPSFRFEYSYVVGIFGGLVSVRRKMGVAGAGCYLRDTWSPWVVPGEIRVATTYSRSGHELRDTWSPWVVPGEIRVATAYSRAKANAILGCALGCTRGFTGGHSKARDASRWKE